MGQNFNIADDGTIERVVSRDKQLDDMLLNVIRIGAEDTALLAAYKARRKCFKYIKAYSNRPDHKEYVQQLQLDNYPDEFHKSMIGQRYTWWLWFSIFLNITTLLIIVSLKYVSSCEHESYVLWELLLLAALTAYNYYVSKRLKDYASQIRKHQRH